MKFYSSCKDMNVRLILLRAVMTQFCCIWDMGAAAGAADSDSECNRRIVNCIQCSTENADPGSQLCRDPFDPRVKKEFKKLHDNSPLDKTGIYKYNISTVICDGFCIKWIKVPMSGGESHIVRTCSTAMDIRFSQNTPVCILESRTGKGTMCFCKENICNSATDVVSSTGSAWLLSLMVTCGMLHLLSPLDCTV